MSVSHLKIREEKMKKSLRRDVEALLIQAVNLIRDHHDSVFLKDSRRVLRKKYVALQGLQDRLEQECKVIRNLKRKEKRLS